MKGPCLRYGGLGPLRRSVSSRIFSWRAGFPFPLLRSSLNLSTSSSSRGLSTGQEELIAERRRKRDIDSFASKLLAERVSDDVSGPKSLEGTVVRVSHGIIVKVEQARAAQVGSIVKIERDDGSSTEGVVVALERDQLVAVLLDTSFDMGVRPGNRVVATSSVPMFPVGPLSEGRVLDPRGRAFDQSEDVAVQPSPTSSVSSPPSHSSHASKLFLKAPRIIDRRPVDGVIYTGIPHLDLFHPFGKGLRLALYGPKGIGKTHLALDVVANQSGRGVHCVYVLLGKSKKQTAHALRQLEERGCMRYSTVIVAAADSSLPIKFLAPLAACQAASYYRDKGEQCLVVFDGVTEYTASFLALEMMCEGTLGLDVQYIHGHVLEHMAQVKLGGSASALCLVDSNLKSYPDAVRPRMERAQENLTGLLDDTVLMDAKLAKDKCWPPLHCGIAMGRPAARFQPKLMRRTRLDLNQRLRQSEFTAKQFSWAAQFGIDPEEQDMEVLEYSAKIQLLLSQQPKTCIDSASLIVLLHAAVKDVGIDLIPCELVPEYSSTLLEFIRNKNPATVKKLMQIGVDEEVSLDLEQELDACFDKFHRMWTMPKIQAALPLLSEEAQDVGKDDDDAAETRSKKRNFWVKAMSKFLPNTEDRSV